MYVVSLLYKSAVYLLFGEKTKNMLEIGFGIVCIYFIVILILCIWLFKNEMERYL